MVYWPVSLGLLWMLWRVSLPDTGRQGTRTTCNSDPRSPEGLGLPQF